MALKTRTVGVLLFPRFEPLERPDAREVPA